MARPAVFNASIGGFSGPSYSAELIGGRVRYRAGDGCGYEYATDELLDPTPEQWQAFLDALDTADIWNWKSHYCNYDVLDGTSWGLTVEVGDRRQESSCENDFPETFNQVLSAISALVGRRDFR